MKPTQTILQLLVWLFISLTFVLLDSIGWSGSLRLGVEGLAKPEIVVLGKLSDSVGSTVSYLKFVQSGNQRIEDLEKQVIELQQKLLAAESTNLELNSLKQAGGTENYTPALVYITGKYIFIENHNFVPGQLVISPEKAAVGLIESSGKWLAKVKLLTDVDSKLGVAVLLPDGNKADGGIKGEFGGNINIFRVVSAVNLIKGAAVVTRGEPAQIPPGILVGWIGEQQSKDESSVYQEAPIIWAVNPDKLNIVLVVK